MTDQEQTPRGGQEVVLVIEDDPDVRESVCAMLQSLDYRVVDAPDIVGARAVLAEDNGVEVVLSDIILPGGVSGTAFVEEVRESHPALKFILMTGYSADHLERGGAVVAETVLLNKPFRIKQLADALHEALA